MPGVRLLVRRPTRSRAVAVAPELDATPCSPSTTAVVASATTRCGTSRRRPRCRSGWASRTAARGRPSRRRATIESAARSMLPSVSYGSARWPTARRRPRVGGVDAWPEVVGAADVAVVDGRHRAVGQRHVEHPALGARDSSGWRQSSDSRRRRPRRAADEAVPGPRERQQVLRRVARVVGALPYAPSPVTSVVAHGPVDLVEPVVEPGGGLRTSRRRARRGRVLGQRDRRRRPAPRRDLERWLFGSTGCSPPRGRVDVVLVELRREAAMLARIAALVGAES